MKTENFFIWAKAREKTLPLWHPLILHMVDVAACADAILEREPETTRLRLADIFELSWDDARSWLLLLIGCHDLGKASPGFQSKWPGHKELIKKAQLEIGPNADRRVLHSFISQVSLLKFLQECGWALETAELAADAVGCHHGVRARPLELADDIEGNRRALGGSGWDRTRRELFDAIREIFKPKDPPQKTSLSGPDFMLISGLTSFADWIGSNPDWFSFGTPQDCGDLSKWWISRRSLANQVLDGLGWSNRTPLSPDKLAFSEVFKNLKPRPLQETVETAVQNVNQPCLLLVEAPMGEGKTEAAFYAHVELQRRFGHRGLYVALPTKATGNAMFDRTLSFLKSFDMKRSLDIQLIHSAAQLNESFHKLILSTDDKSDNPDAVRAAEWFTHKKKALLSEYGVGTVDQALLPILPVRHFFMRMWGLANRVVILDEIHAYDTYTGTLILHLIRWLLALGSSVIMLSATLPPSFRRKLSEIVNAPLPEPEPTYPRLSVFQMGKIEQIHFDADPNRHRTIRLKKISPDLEAIKDGLLENSMNGGMGLALVNTVDRAQKLYRLFGGGKPVEVDGARVGKQLSDGTVIHLLHGRFPADRRQTREDHVLSIYGPTASRDGKKILIATQVAEQSLDLDFDLIATDLAPIDLVLQRAGRLWRHQRSWRPVKEPVLLVAGLAGTEPPSFGIPLWWNKVYFEDFLLRTWVLLRGKESIQLPEEIDDLVRIVYEDLVNIPEILKKSADSALPTSEGERYAQAGQAHQAIIGLPDDDSWKTPAFIKMDEDDPGFHPSLVAATRLGDRSVVAIPIFHADGFNLEEVPEHENAKLLFQRSIAVNRQGFVQRLTSGGVPKGWQASPLLRNAFPLVLDIDRRWNQDKSIRLDDDLGLVYEPKEVS